MADEAIVRYCAKCHEVDILDCREKGCPNTAKFSAESKAFTDGLIEDLNNALKQRGDIYGGSGE